MLESLQKIAKGNLSSSAKSDISKDRGVQRVVFGGRITPDLTAPGVTPDLTAPSKILTAPPYFEPPELFVIVFYHANYPLLL